MCTPVCKLHVAFKIPYMYGYMTQFEVILNYVNRNIRGVEQGEVRHRKYKGLKLGDGQAYDSSSDYMQFLSN
jgi:hypothetical protein